MLQLIAIVIVIEHSPTVKLENWLCINGTSETNCPKKTKTKANAAQTRQLCVEQCSVGQEQACSGPCHTERSSSLRRTGEYPAIEQQ